MTFKEAYIIDGIRTPIGKFAGGLSAVRPDDLAAHVISEVIKRNKNLIVEDIDDVVFGCANQAGEDNRNVARMALLLAGLPHTVPGETINRLCASGMSSVVRCAQAIARGEGDLFIAGGVESMTRAPYVLSKAETPFARNVQLFDTSIGWRFVNERLKAQYGVDSMGETAENLAQEYNISREEQDTFAYNSQMKYKKALERGFFVGEIVPVSVPRRKQEPLLVDKDEFPRPNTTLDKLASLRPAFKKDGTVTAGNSSGINDGACALLVASQTAVDKYKLKPLAKILSSAVVGVPPRIMGIGPVGASRKALQRCGLDLKKIDLIELNEAFSAQVLACLKELGLPADDSRLNPNGGALALGHPLGMTGARLLLTAARQLKESNLRYALCTMCIGVGQGMATVIENCDL